MLIGGLRVLGANFGRLARTAYSRIVPRALTNDFFVNLLRHGDGVDRSPSMARSRYEGRDRKTGRGPLDRPPSVDLVFGSNSQLRALAEVYASDDAQRKFIDDFVAAWTKVMNLDRFERK